MDAEASRGRLPAEDTRSFTRVFLENLPKDIRKEQIDRAFNKYGTIAKVYLIYDPPGSGFVEYLDERDAEYACNQIDGAEFMGSRVAAKVTRGGVPRGRGMMGSGMRGRGGGSYGSFSPRGRGFSRGGSNRGSFRGSDYEGGRGGRRFSRGRFGEYRGGSEYLQGGRGFSHGGSYKSGGFEDGYFTERYSESSYDHSRDNGYSTRSHDEGYDIFDNDSYEKYPVYEDRSHRSTYAPRSRSPVSHSPGKYRESPGYSSARSRSPVGRSHTSEHYRSHRSRKSPSSPAPVSRDMPRSHRRNYSPTERSYTTKETLSSSYGGHRSPVDPHY